MWWVSFSVTSHTQTHTGCTHWYEQLDDAVQDFDVLVFQPAAQHRGQLRVLLVLPSSGGKAIALTARPVVLPPGTMWRHTQRKDVAVLQTHTKQTDETWMQCFSVQTLKDTVFIPVMCGGGDGWHAARIRCAVNLIWISRHLTSCLEPKLTNNYVSLSTELSIDLSGSHLCITCQK